MGQTRKTGEQTWKLGILWLIILPKHRRMLLPKAIASARLIVETVVVGGGNELYSVPRCN